MNMTLKEKFQNVLKFQIIHSDYLPLSNNQKNECVLIADNYAIEFAEWLLDSWTHPNFIYKEPKELLEIFKKEKGL